MVHGLYDEDSGEGVVKKNYVLHISCIILAIVLGLVSCGTVDSWYSEKLISNELMCIDESDQTIAFIDTGINERLINEYNVIDCYNALNETETMDDVNGHGTAVISAACGNGYNGVHGIAQNARIIVIKAADEYGRMSQDALYKSLCYAYTEGVDIVNISLGGYQSDTRVEDIIAEMTKQGVTVVAASGDYGQKDILFPANVAPYVISVASLDKDFQITSDSNIDKTLATAFPGVEIKVLREDLKVSYEDGTSEATALASAYIAKYKAAYEKEYGEEVPNNELRQLLYNIAFSDDRHDYIRPFESLKDRGVQ